MKDLKVMRQASRTASPWPKSELVKVILFRVVWGSTCRYSPKGLGRRWRRLVLAAFGCQLGDRPFIAPSAIIRAPWRLTLGDRACLGPGSEVYNLGQVTIGARATVAQHAYLCGGSHDFSQPHLPLTTGPITIEADAFVGAKALVLAGVRVGERAVVGAGAVVAKDVPADRIVVGNPARILRTRLTAPALPSADAPQDANFRS